LCTRIREAPPSTRAGPADAADHHFSPTSTPRQEPLPRTRLGRLERLCPSCGSGRGITSPPPLGIFLPRQHVHADLVRRRPIHASPPLEKPLSPLLHSAIKAGGAEHIPALTDFQTICFPAESPLVR